MNNDKKLLLLIKALLNGLRYECADGTTIGMDEDYRPYIVAEDEKGKEKLLNPLFEFDLAWLAKEAEQMSDKQEVSIVFQLSNMKEEERIV